MQVLKPICYCSLTKEFCHCLQPWYVVLDHFCSKMSCNLSPHNHLHQHHHCHDDPRINLCVYIRMCVRVCVSLNRGFACDAINNFNHVNNQSLRSTACPTAYMKKYLHTHLLHTSEVPRCIRHLIQYVTKFNILGT